MNEKTEQDRWDVIRAEERERIALEERKVIGYEGELSRVTAFREKEQERQGQVIEIHLAQTRAFERIAAALEKMNGGK